MEQKLGVKGYCAYGIGQACDTIPYCMFYTYFVYYLTDVVGLSPAVSGLVSLIGVCWDGITDPIVGYLSDRTRNPKGRRRPWMIKTIVPEAVIVFMLFAPFEFSSTATATVYYIVISILFWTLYTTYVIPYMSLAAEMTSDYKERNYLRVYNMIFGGIFMLFCTSGPQVVCTWAANNGMSLRDAWGVSGAIFGAIALIFGFICCVATRGAEKPATEEILNQDEGIIQVIKETMKIKSYRILCIAVVLFFIGDIACSTAGVYFLTYVCGLDSNQQALYFLVYSLAYVGMVPLDGIMMNKLGKKKAINYSMIFLFIMGVAAFLLKIHTLLGACILVTLTMFTVSMLFTAYVALAYDVAELDEYINGKRREGSLVSIVSFAQKLGSAIGTYVCGIILTIIGYDATLAVQSETTVSGILALVTLLPAFAGLVFFLIMLKFPIGPKEYECILQANADKKAGRPVDESGFKNCL